MAGLMANELFTFLGKAIKSQHYLNFSTTRTCYHFGSWRKQNGLEPNYTEYGPLTNKPDYSFVDGRPVPVSSNLAKRMAKQKEYAERIVKLSSEIDFAIARHETIKKAEAMNKRNIIASKLKPKGEALLLKNQRKSSKIG